MYHPPTVQGAVYNPMYSTDAIASFETLEGRHGARLPQRSSRGAGGFDLYADLSSTSDNKLTLEPGQRQLVPTGVRMVTERDYPHAFAAMIVPRSGLAHKSGVTVMNAPGLVDEDYRGELFVNLVNLGDVAYTVDHGDRVAQIVFTSLVNPYSMSGWVVGYDTGSERGAGGHGSTGR